MVPVHAGEVEGGSAVGRIVLPSGHTLTFDETDRPLVEQYRWFAVPSARTVRVRGYRRSGPAQLAVQVHRLILNAPAGLDVDHRNGNGLDDRRANLRLCTHALNLANAPVRLDNSSGYKGVTRDRQRGKWLARIKVDGRTRNLGRFDDAWAAAQAYNAAALAAWGEFARLNEKAAV